MAYYGIEETSETKTDRGRRCSSELASGCSLRSSKEHNKLERSALITPVGQGPFIEIEWLDFK